MISEIRKEYSLLHKENQDLKAEMQNLKNYYEREKLISHNRKAMRDFPSRPHNRKIRYQRSYESSGNEETDDEEKYNVNSKKKKPRKNIMMRLMAIMMTLMTILMIMRMTKNFQKMIMIIMIMMKNTIKIKITKK